MAPDTPDTPAPLLLTPAEGARALHINRSTLYPLLMRWIAQQVSEQQVNM